MTTILQINSSLFGAAGNSTQLSAAFVQAYLAQKPNTRVVQRDLAAQTLAHLQAEHVMAYATPAEARTSEQQALVAESDVLVAELQQADILVLGVPMYNFGIPSTLKAYFDRIARAGLTFRYTEHGPQGLLQNKPVWVFATRGGQYVGTALDTETNYLRDILGFLGLTDVTFIYAEGLNMGDAIKQQALANAHAQILSLKFSSN